MAWCLDVFSLHQHLSHTGVWEHWPHTLATNSLICGWPFKGYDTSLSPQDLIWRELIFFSPWSTCILRKAPSSEAGKFCSPTVPALPLLLQEEGFLWLAARSDISQRKPHLTFLPWGLGQPRWLGLGLDLGHGRAYMWFQHQSRCPFLQQELWEEGKKMCLSKADPFGT